MATRETLDEFLKGQSWAVVGASNDRSKYGNITFRELQRRGKQVYPVNKTSTQIEGETCYASLAELPEPVERVLIVVPPRQSEAVVREAAEAGIDSVWFQPGAESKAALAYCESRGMVAVSGHCILRTT